MSIIYTILIFGIIILIHELGHYIAARACKITVAEFSIGMGPAVWKHVSKKSGIQYTVRLLPVGGYVMMPEQDSELPEGMNVPSDIEINGFSRKPIWQRIIVILAGAIMNLLLGFIIMFCIYAQQPIYNSATVAEFLPDASTQQSGLQVGDRIIKMNKTTILNDRDIVFEMLRDPDSKIDVVVKRNGEKVKLSQVAFKYTGEGAEKRMVIDFKVVGVKRTVFSSIDYTFRNTVSLARNSWVSIGQIFTGEVKLSELSGPVGVGQAVDEARGIGWGAVAMLAGFITISVGMFNLLPFPALDGGRFVFLLIESVTRKPINKKIENGINAAGMLLLLGLTVLITFKDIFKLF